MQTKLVAFCTAVAVLGIISAAAGFAAEATKIKASDVYIVEDYCVYPNSNPALALGIIAAVLAIITRIYISVTYGGFSCCRSDSNWNPFSKLLYVFSWVASVIGVVLLFAGVVLNNEEGEQVDSYGYITCYVVKSGIFAAGAVLALLSAVFGIAACLLATQTITNPGVEFPMSANVDVEKNDQVASTPQQCHP